jgi:16S rRNA processing protein RimM
VGGLVRIRPFTSAIDGLLEYRELLMSAPNGQWQPARVRQGRVHGDQLVVELEGVGSREQAAALRGREVAVWRDALPDEAPDEVYLVDLLGARVQGRDGREFGRVEGFIDVGSTQVMRVRADAGGDGREETHRARLEGVGGAGRQNAPEAGRPATRETLIPFVPDYVVEVDLERAVVTVDWTEG